MHPPRRRSDPGSPPKTVAEAVKADIIFLAIRFQQHPDVAKALPSWQGKIIVDVTNAYGVPDQELDGQPSAKVVAQAFAGGRLVKGFNHLVAAVLDQDPAAHGGKRVVFLTSDDDGAADEVATLAENLGFALIKHRYDHLRPTYLNDFIAEVERFWKEWNDLQKCACDTRLLKNRHMVHISIEHSGPNS